jgi:hypothetical protein
MPVMPQGALCPAGAYDQADDDAGDYTISVGTSRRGPVVAHHRLTIVAAPEIESAPAWGAGAEK